VILTVFHKTVNVSFHYLNLLCKVLCKRLVCFIKGSYALMSQRKLYLCIAIKPRSELHMIMEM